MLFVVYLNQKLQVKTEKKLDHQLLVVVEVQGHLLEVWRTLHLFLSTGPVDKSVGRSALLLFVTMLPHGAASLYLARSW